MLSAIVKDKNDPSTEFGPMDKVVPERYHDILKDLFSSLVASLAEGKEIGYAVFFGKADSFKEDKLTLAPILTDGGVLFRLTLGLAQHEAEQEDADLAISISEQWTLPKEAIKTPEEAKAVIEAGNAAFEARPDKETICLVAIEAPEGKFIGKAKIHGDVGQPRNIEEILFATGITLRGQYMNFLSFRDKVPPGVPVH